VLLCYLIVYMFGTLNNHQPKCGRPTLLSGVKFVGVLTPHKGVKHITSNNDSGIHQGSGEPGNITRHHGSESGNDGVGKALHD